VILPGSDARRAYALAEKMRLAVRGLALRQAPDTGAPHPGAPHTGGIVTFSAGVATYVPGRGTGEWRATVGEADAALYAAKAGGRDMVKTQQSPAASDSPVPLAAVRANFA